MSGEVRGLKVMGSYLYSVIGNEVHRTNTTAISTIMYGNLLTTTGRVYMAENGTQLMIVDGTYGYIVSGGTITRITDSDFPTPTMVCYQDGYFIVSQSATANFFISSLLDGTSWDALDYANAESSPDNLQGVVSANRELWLIGERSFEVWYNSGDSTFPFARVSGAFGNIGCIARGSIYEYEGNVAWLDHNRRVVAKNGYGLTRISTDQVDYQIGIYSVVSDAIAFIYSQEGHTFYVLTFPSELKTWAYDFTTNLWHTRASGPTDGRHRANCYALFDGKHIVGDYAYGTLYQYDLSKYTENGEMIRRIRAAQAVNNDRNMLFHHSFEVEFESGVGLVVDDPDIGSGTDPQAILQFSNDGGHTWSSESWADISVGAVGQYKTRVIWRRLGQAIDRVYKVTMADPVKTVMIGAHLNVSGGTR